MSRLRFVLAILVAVFVSANALPLKAQSATIVIRQLDNMVTQTPAWDQLIAAFKEVRPDVEIQREVLSNLPEVVQFAFTGDNAPHILAISTLQEPQLRSLVEGGYIYSLDNFADFEEFRQTFPNPELAVMSGRNVFDDVVVSMKWDADLFWHQYYINLDLYEQAGIVDANGEPIIPRRWDEVVANAYTIHEETGAYGFGLPGANPFLFSLVLWTCHLSSVEYGPRGFGFDMRTGEFSAADNECIKTVINDVLRMRDDGVMPADALAIDDEPNRAMFAEGQVAHIITGTWSITGWEQTHPDFTNYTSIPVPLVNTDVPLHFYQSSPAGVNMSISSVAAEDPAVLEATWQWFKFIYSEEFGRIWAETGNGLSIFTPGEPTDYANQQNRGYFETANFFAPHPEGMLALRNPNVGKLEQTLVGPNEADVLLGIYSGQLTDVQAALEDLDQRYTTAFEQALADAQAAGIEVTKEDFIVRDWDPAQPYPHLLEPGYYPGAESQ
jgi:ABC-type glycerol-3-phosphate transport system substrate-binding protein